MLPRGVGRPNQRVVGLTTTDAEFAQSAEQPASVAWVQPHRLGEDINAQPVSVHWFSAIAPGIRVRTENASSAAWPANLGRRSTTAAWHGVCAACAASSAATATLVATAHTSNIAQNVHVRHTTCAMFRAQDSPTRSVGYRKSITPRMFRPSSRSR